MVLSEDCMNVIVINPSLVRVALLQERNCDQSKLSPGSYVART